MPKSKPSPSAQRLIAAVADAARGCSRRQIQARHRLPERLCRMITAAGLGQDEFRELLLVKIRELADLSTDQIRKKLEADQFKPHELSFLLAVLVDRHQRLESHRQVAGAAVNVAINDIGPHTREEVLTRLAGNVSDLPPPGGAGSLSPRWGRDLQTGNTPFP